ncbi:organic hydroperoxide resistance protein [Sphingobium fuliginis]|jgi:Ohr subfamily peroxiredoxin|uniref:Organic hydroperoxide resistance protein n=1 Tax=Sphingobium fuliginis (strain ATCC 27551) TaxID=336203 RepID=A0A4Q4IT57_SPHSA|nr:organic hydroperoxide resistance protein [Sphingobium fuliginis]QOT74308.1 organic hydroperoxide resistance protein [Sphingobium fuliginis]RYL96507.1 organic hydroperoxide resistance protein [Sphingobium fuliginis]GGA00841.1 organic hydroperoxide resistance protein [Sphingobium fuliginis]
MGHLYTTKVTAIGGRSGTVRSEDGILDLQLAMPKELGGKGGATNPEQLFAAGYAACFENAVIHVTRAQADRVRDEDVEVTGEVGLLPDDRGGFRLAVTLGITIRGVDQAAAEKIVQAAHAVCPYSNAVKGNVDVQLDVTTR